jgi:putative ABC transport system substrate-binding protein
MKLRKLITLIGGLAIAWSPTCYAQQSQSGPPKRIALLSRFECPLPDDPILRTGLRSFWEILHRRLEELGWIEGRTIAFECVSMVGRWDQLPALAREVVSKRPDVLIAVAPAAVMALKGETPAIPIVMINTPEPERMGLITNLARPRERYRDRLVQSVPPADGTPEGDCPTSKEGSVRHRRLRNGQDQK